MVNRIFKRRSSKIGLPPGTMVHIGEKKAETVRLTVIDYSEQQASRLELASVDQAVPFKEKPTVTWLDIMGLHDISVLEKLGQVYNIHPLILEDILNTDQRPKIEVFDDYVFIVLKMLTFEEENQEIRIEQVSMILGAGFVITFQEREGDVFNPVRSRILEGKGRVRRQGSDYLAYSLMDVIIDHYFLILEKLGEIIEDLEGDVIQNPTPALVSHIQHIKRELILLRKAVWPLREVITAMVREEHPLIQRQTIPFLRDIYDHTIQVMDTVETFRDMVSGILDIYLSSLSNRMNEVMKLLTIIATLFIPLTFIVGVYGMNFEYMPELKWKLGYPMVWGVMILISLGMLLFFRKKKWL